MKLALSSILFLGRWQLSSKIKKKKRQRTIEVLNLKASTYVLLALCLFDVTIIPISKRKKKLKPLFRHDNVGRAILKIFFPLGQNNSRIFFFSLCRVC